MFASTADPLFELTSGKSKFTFGPKQRESFVKLRSILEDTHLLRFPDFDRPFAVIIDPDSGCVSIVLMQKGIASNRWQQISHASRKLRPNELKYTSAEQVVVGILWAITKLKAALFYLPFKVFTCNTAASYLLSSASLEGRVAKWALQLTDKNFEVKVVRTALMQYYLNTVPVIDGMAEDTLEVDYTEAQKTNKVIAAVVDKQDEPPDPDWVVGRTGRMYLTFDGSSRKEGRSLLHPLVQRMGADLGRRPVRSQTVFKRTRIHGSVPWRPVCSPIPRQ